MERNKRIVFNRLVLASRNYSSALMGDMNTKTEVFVGTANAYSRVKREAEESLSPIDITRAQAMGANWSGDKRNARQQNLWLVFLRTAKGDEISPTLLPTPITLHR